MFPLQLIEQDALTSRLKKRGNNDLGAGGTSGVLGGSSSLSAASGRTIAADSATVHHEPLVNYVGHIAMVSKPLALGIEHGKR